MRARSQRTHLMGKSNR